MSVAVNAATGAARFESTELGTDPANWGDELEANYGEALDKFRVSHNSSTGIVSIGLMTMKPEHQGEGVGTKILEDLTQAADDNGITLSLTPEKFGNTSKSRLTAFYKRHGFVPNKGRNKDFGTQDHMVRQPD